MRATWLMRVSEDADNVADGVNDDAKVTSSLKDGPEASESRKLT